MSAGVIFVDADGGVLMQHRDDDPKIMFPGHWGLIGGASLPGESAEDTARRETQEETGLTPPRIEPFRAYYTTETPTRGKGPSTDYDLYLFHAPCETRAGDLACGEGRELRFFSPDDLASLDIAYNHRDVLADFFASPVYAQYRRGTPFGEASDPVAAFRKDLQAGGPWFDALMEAIAIWERPQETVAGRDLRYLIGGEAFDWLLLAERLIGEAGGRIPAAEAERLLFEAVPPVHEGKPLDDEELRRLIGDSKHRAHLNYVYGVTVEEALQYAAELEIAKEQRSVSIRDGRTEDAFVDPVYERIYGRPRSELLRDFREERGLAHTTLITLSELREFMYWLFKYRVANAEPARVASDTRKALAQLSAMEDAVRRTRRRAPAPEEVLAT